MILFCPNREANLFSQKLLRPAIIVQRTELDSQRMEPTWIQIQFDLRLNWILYVYYHWNICLHGACSLVLLHYQTSMNKSVLNFYQLLM